MKKNEINFLLFILVGLFLFVAIKSAWVCDDAYISFRTLGNFLHGDGLKYNLAERVQSFTHPLWLFALAAPAFFTGEPYYTSIFLSLLLSAIAVALVAFKIARSWQGAAAAVVILTLSKAFVDYSTSGLENPLTHLILAGFALVFFNFEKGERKLFFLSSLAALAALTRMDLLLMVLPALAYEAWQVRRWKVIAAGFLPFILWEGFSLFYYGFLFPNTAYAKLNTEVPSFLLLQQGFYYFLNSLHLDPLTLFVVAAGLVSSLLKEQRKTLPLAFGVVLYLIYVLKIGGDFMSGRFFAAPLLAAAMIIARLELSNLTFVFLAASIAAFGLMSPYSPVFSNADYGKQRDYLIDAKGVADERGWYYPELGMLNAYRFQPSYRYLWDKEKKSGAELAVNVGMSNVGRFSFLAGPEVHYVDVYALVDPLLARLPAYPDPFWRIGHFARKLPDGYLETLRSGRNEIKNKDLARYYDKLLLISRGKLFSVRRLTETIKFNLGFYDHLKENAVFRVKVGLKEIESSKEAGAAYNAAGNVLISSRRGLEIDLKELFFAKTIEISLDHNDRYSLAYLSGGRLLARQEISPKILPNGGLAVSRLGVPAAASAKGFNKIKVSARGGDGVYSLGHLRPF